ncbi:MAG: polymer-forming cytoskeletal protein [Gammaproteobacteria bacterium]
MWGNKKKPRQTAQIDSLIGQNTEIHGDVIFSGGLHVDGKVKGNVVASGNEQESVLTLSERGTIEGEVKVPNVVINGTIIGDVHALTHVELAAQARVHGNVYYSLIEMAMGAEVNGNLVHRPDQSVVSIKKREDKSGSADS